MTVRQIYLPSLMGSGALGSDTPALRTASLSSYDQMEILDVIHLEYGASLESISLFGRINHVNPFARATYDLGEKSAVKVAVSSGSQPVELLADGTQQDLGPKSERGLGGPGTNAANLAPRQPGRGRAKQGD